MDKGTVKRTENGFAYIEMEINASCRSCSNKAVCMAGDKPAQIRISNDNGLQAGDVVEIDLPAQTKLTAGFLIFILPVIFTFAGYYIGYMTVSTDTAGMIGALSGLVAGVTGVMLINKLSSRSAYFKPRSVRKI